MGRRTGYVALLVLIVLFLLRSVFAGRWIVNPIAFHIGALSIRWYGIFMAAAIGGAYEWSRRRLIARGIDQSIAESIVWWGSVAGIIGARLGFVLQNLGYYAAHASQMFNVMQGGLSIHGAVIGGAIGVWIVARRAQLPFLFLADVTVPTVLAGTVLGRLGNFLNYELYGYPTSVGWKMFVPIQYRLPGYEQFSYFHPTFLYEALLNLGMLAIILWIERRYFKETVNPSTNLRTGSKKKTATVSSHSRFTIHDSPGSLFFLTIALYSVSRFIVEFFRIGHPIGWHLTLAQWVSLGIVMISTMILARGLRANSPQFDR